MRSRERLPATVVACTFTSALSPLGDSAGTQLASGCSYPNIATAPPVAHYTFNAVEGINKVQDGSPNAVDEIRNGRIHLVINTPKGSGAQRDSFPMRRAALEWKVPYFTTIAGAAAAAEGIEFLRRQDLGVRSLQEYHGRG